MPILHAIVLGIVQGLTEFLPISSSGHLAIVPWLFNWKELTNNPDLNQTFDVALHIGTFVGALAYFWRDIWDLVSNRSRHRMGLLLLALDDPGGPGRPRFRGVAGRCQRGAHRRDADRVRPGSRLCRPAHLARVPPRWATRRSVPATPRSWASRRRRRFSPACLARASRSRAGRLLGFDRESAARISFLMAMPVIAGAGAVKGLKVLADGGLGPGLAAPFVWGMLASAVTGAFAVWFLLRLVKTRSFMPFVVYRVVAGLAIIGIAVAR